jgi:hypothetical protein
VPGFQISRPHGCCEGFFCLAQRTVRGSNISPGISEVSGGHFVSFYLARQSPKQANCFFRFVSLKPSTSLCDYCLVNASPKPKPVRECFGQAGHRISLRNLTFLIQ